MSDFGRDRLPPTAEQQPQEDEHTGEQAGGDRRMQLAMRRRMSQRKAQNSAEAPVQMKRDPGAQAHGGAEHGGAEHEGAEHEGHEGEAGALPVSEEHDASEHEADEMAAEVVGAKGEAGGGADQGQKKDKLKDKSKPKSKNKHAEPGAAAEGGPAEKEGEDAASEVAEGAAESAKKSGAEGEKHGAGAAAGLAGGAKGEAKVAMKKAGGAKSDPGSVAAAAIRGKGEGASLPPAMQEQFGAAYGQEMAGVRVHTDAKAGKAADRAGAEAFTYGKDVFFGSGRYKPDTEHGQFVLAHELAHVAQQGAQKSEVRPKRVETGHEGDHQEEEASHAADAALAGGEAPVGKSAPKIRFFAQNDGSANRGGHAYMTERSLAGMGVDDTPGKDGGPADTRIARMGNWERDLSQVFTPATAAYAKDIFPLLNLLAIKDFGRGIDAASFGTYDPVEHIDNPTDLRGTDVTAQGGMVSSATEDPAKAGNNPDNANTIGPGGPTGNAGTEHEAYADKEARYKAENGHKDKGKVINPDDARAYQVDQTGIPKYIYASKEWLTETLRNSARLGRQKHEEGDERLHGPRLFASGTHTLQDYYAHSNFCEIAINQLIRDGGLQVMQASGEKTKLDKLGGDVKGKVLDTQVHANDKKGDPMQGNLAIGDPGKGGREVLTTGSFNLTDTAASLLEEVNENWKILDPFKEKSKGPNKLTMAALDYLEMNPESPTDFSGAAKTMAGMVHGLVGPVEELGKGMATGVSLAGKVGGGVVSGAGKVGGGALKGVGGALGWLGGKMGGKVGGALGKAGDSVSGAGGSVANAGDNAGKSIAGDADKGAEAIRFFIGQVQGVEKMIGGKQHTLRDLYSWLDTHGPLDLLKMAAKSIPVIGPKVAALVDKVQDEMNSLIRGMFGTAWNKVLDMGSAKINSVIAKIKGQTNVKNKKKTPTGSDKDKAVAEKFGNVSEFYDQKTGKPKENKETGTSVGIAPGSYTPPSHTEVAKDHGDVKNHGEDGDTHAKGDAEGGHEEQGAWLNGVAQKLAMVATQGVGKPVSALWDVVDAGGKVGANDPRLNTINEAVDLYFQHPMDCDFWRPIMSSELGGKLGPDLIAHLKDAHAGTPDTPSHVPIPADHPINKTDGGGAKKNTGAAEQAPPSAPPK